MTVLYLYKEKKSDAPWSSVISTLGAYCKENIANCEKVAIDNSTFLSLIFVYRYLLKKELKKDDCIIFNHAIVFWLLIPIFVFYKLKNVKIIFLMHEHEFILGKFFLVKNIFKFKVKEYLRHFKFWYVIPSFISTYVYCLSQQQIDYLNLKNAFRISYLGIDPQFFPEKDSNSGLKNDILRVLFPHDKNRFDKGFRFCNFLSGLDKCLLVEGRAINYNYDDVYRKYHESDIVFLPSDSESYSLVLIESLATNSIVVTNANIGVVQLLLSKYTIDELSEMGLFISEHNEKSYAATLSTARSFLINKKSSTKSLFLEFDFSLESINKKFVKFITSHFIQ